MLNNNTHNGLPFKDFFNEIDDPLILKMTHSNLG